VDLIEDGVDARRRRVHTGRATMPPDFHVETGDRLANRRRFRQLRHRLHRNARERAHLAFPDLAERGRDGDDSGVDFILEQRCQHSAPDRYTTLT
jgi:hypothetical protein